MFKLFVSKYLSGVPVNWLDKLSALSTINKPLNLFFFFLSTFPDELVTRVSELAPLLLLTSSFIAVVIFRRFPASDFAASNCLIYLVIFF